MVGRTFERTAGSVDSCTDAWSDTSSPSAVCFVLLLLPLLWPDGLVGCVQGPKYHDVLWFTLKDDMPHMCPMCSQVFVLEKIDVAEEAH